MGVSGLNVPVSLRSQEGQKMVEKGQMGNFRWCECLQRLQEDGPTGREVIGPRTHIADAWAPLHKVFMGELF